MAALAWPESQSVEADRASPISVCPVQPEQQLLEVSQRPWVWPRQLLAEEKWAPSVPGKTPEAPDLQADQRLQKERTPSHWLTAQTAAAPMTFDGQGLQHQ
jgi:hypothetical protein